MKTYGILFAAMIAVSTAAAPVQAGVLDKKATKSSEVIGPAAKGDPKPYHARVEGTCSTGFCIVNFGKKPKVRHIRIITCGVITDVEPQLGGVIFGEQADGDIRFFFPLASVAPQGMSKVGMFEFQFDFDVPADTKMQVVLQASNTPSTGVCTATGTIE
jgi:hypothetical protein